MIWANELFTVNVSEINTCGKHTCGEIKKHLVWVFQLNFCQHQL